MKKSLIWKTMQQISAIVACLAGVFCVAGAVLATEGGGNLYAPGYISPQAGLLPDPGTYFGYNLYWYKGDSTTNIDVSGPVQIPGTDFTAKGTLNGSIKAEVDSTAHLFSLTHVFEKKIWGGQVGISVLVPYIKADLDLTGSGTLVLTGPLSLVTVTIPLSGGIQQSESGIGDVSVSGLLGWHDGNMHYMAMLNVYAPTGEYDKSRLVNTGKNHWAIEPMGAMTYLDTTTGRELSGAAGFTFNQENSDTHYKSGTEFHLDAAAIQHFSEKLYLGLVGYAYKQITGDSGSGAVEDYKGKVYAYGAVIGSALPLGEKHKLYLNARYYHESGAENRLEGDTVFFTAAGNF